MPKVILTVGIPASGKTWWSKEYVKTHPNTVIISRDDIRMAQGLAFGDNELWITRLHRLQIAAVLNDGIDTIVADTNMHPPFRNSLISFAHFHNAPVEIKMFPVELDVALRRDAARSNAVGVDVIEGFYDRWMRMDPLDKMYYPVPVCH